MQETSNSSDRITKAYYRYTRLTNRWINQTINNRCSPLCYWLSILVAVCILAIPLIVTTVYLSTRSEPYESLFLNRESQSKLASSKNLSKVLFKNGRFENPWINNTESSAMSIFFNAVKSIFNKDEKLIPSDKEVNIFKR